MNARTRRGRDIIRNRRRRAADARRLRYIDGIYRDAYTGSLRLAASAYEIHTGRQMLDLLADVLLVDREEGWPCAAPLTEYELFLVNRYA